VAGELILMRRASLLSDFFISQLSLHSRFWYPLAKFAAVVTRPVRRMMNALHASNAAVR